MTDPIEPTPGHATRLLNRLADDPGAPVQDELFGLIYGELRELARGHMLREQDGHTLQPTALVHEAYVRLVGGTNLSFQSRGHFYSMASRVMRSLLVDHARRKKAEKRGGDRVRVALEGVSEGVRGDRELDLLAVHETVENLSELNPELGRVVELRFFGGLSLPQVAETLDVPLRTIERRWRLASAWLHERLADT